MNSIYKQLDKIDDSKSLDEKWNVKNQRELKKLKESLDNTVNSANELEKLHESTTEIPFTTDELENGYDDENYDRIIEWAEQTIFSDVHGRLKKKYNLYSEPSGGYDVVTQRSSFGELKCIIDLDYEYELLMEDLADGDTYESIVNHLTEWISNKTFEDGSFEGIDLILKVDQMTEDEIDSLTDEDHSDLQEMDVDEYIDEYYYPVDLENLIGFPVESNPELYVERAVKLFVSYAEKGVGVLLQDDSDWTNEYNFLFVPSKVTQSESWGDYDSVENAKKYLATIVHESLHLTEATKDQEVAKITGYLNSKGYSCIVDRDTIRVQLPSGKEYDVILEPDGTSNPRGVRSRFIPYRGDGVVTNGQLYDNNQRLIGRAGVSVIKSSNDKNYKIKNIDKVIV